MKNFPKGGNVIGIDIGSVSLSIVQMSLNGKILDSAYTFHKGNIRKSLREIQKNINLSQVCGEQPVPLVAPPVLLDIRRQEDDIAAVILSIDPDGPEPESLDPHAFFNLDIRNNY